MYPLAPNIIIVYTYTKGLKLSVVPWRVNCDYFPFIEVFIKTLENSINNKQTNKNNTYNILAFGCDNVKNKTQIN